MCESDATFNIRHTPKLDIVQEKTVAKMQLFEIKVVPLQLDKRIKDNQ